MKIIQSFWTKPTLKNGQIEDSRLNGGWPHRMLNYFSWALSCLELRRHYEEVELVTDRLGKAILIDKLGLPYTAVFVELNKLDKYDDRLWALGKLHAYAMQDAPFLHVDNDIFISNRFNDDISTAMLVAQNREMNEPAYNSIFKDIEESFLYIPSYLKEQAGQQFMPACNVGIIGGHDVDFIREYAGESFKFFHDNLAIIDYLKNVLNVSAMNIIFEQAVFYHLARQRGKEITYLFPDKNIPPGLGFVHKAEVNKGFVHCIGSYKQNRVVYTLLQDQLRKKYPDYHDRIVQLISTSEL